MTPERIALFVDARRISTLAAVLAAVLLTRCAPAPSAIHSAPSLGAQGSGASQQLTVADVQPVDAASAAPLVRAISVSRCPLIFDDADVELARVGGQSITACDVALVSIASLREGGAPLSPREALARAVRDATFAREASSRGLDREPETLERLQRTLEDGVVRDAARRVFVAPERATIQRYFDEHRAEFDRSARVHVRAIVLDNERAARDAIRALGQGADFAELARARSIIAGAQRDDGDLGLAMEEGSDLVPRAVAQRAFALSEFGAVDPDPVRVEVTALVGRRRRPQTRVRFFVVQRLERIEAEPATLDGVARRIAYRLSLSGFRAALVRVRSELLAAAQATDAVSIDARALSRVSLRVETRSGRARRSSRVAAPRRR